MARKGPKTLQEKMATVALKHAEDRAKAILGSLGGLSTEDFAERLKQGLTSAGITPEELANKLEVGRHSVKTWLDRSSAPLKRLQAEALQLLEWKSKKDDQSA